MLENSYATSAIVLTVLGIEAYRNRIMYLDKKTVGNVSSDLSNTFASKNPQFPMAQFERMIEEVFVIRDVIVHNHIYEVSIVSDGNWDMISHRQKLLEGYGDDRKYRNHVNNRTRKTKYLGLNIQPGKIGFEDLFVVLVVFDTFIGISNGLLGNGYVPFRFLHELKGAWVDSLSKYLSHYYALIPNPKYTEKLSKLLIQLNKNFSDFLHEYVEYFIKNKCYRCGSFGFNKPHKIHKCDNCGAEIKITTNDFKSA